jgi:ribosome recycling factor
VTRAAADRLREASMKPGAFDLAEIKRRMQGAIQLLRTEFGGLRTGRASPSLVEPVHVEAYGQSMPLNQVASIAVPEPKLISIQVWDKSVVTAVEKAIRASNLGLNPQTEGQTIRLRIPELNQERRQELVKIAHKYAEAARVAVRHVRRDGIDGLKKSQKEGHVSEDEIKRHEAEVQKTTDAAIAEIDQTLAQKEKEIMSV